jgi:hypothetical protein
MTDNHSPQRSLESLKKDAKRWLNALRAGVLEARERFERALGQAPDNPTLRDIQHALACERGYVGWIALRDAVAVEQYEAMARTLLAAYETGTPEAMEAFYRFTWHRRAWPAMRRYVEADLGKSEVTLDDARYLIAREHGFADWRELASFASRDHGRARLAAKPVGVGNAGRSRRWTEIIELLRAHPAARLEANGQMTDDALADLSRLDTIEDLDLGGSKTLTDDGVRHLARLPRLKRLNLSGTAITDRGLQVLNELPNLQTLSLAWTRVTDDGMRPLASCHDLEELDLAGTPTGDGALRAVAGKQKLRHLHSGDLVTDAGMPLLHELPVFSTWHGGAVELALLSYRAAPNQLSLHGSFTDHGMQAMRGLDGLFGLNIDDARLPLTAACLRSLTSLPNLGFLAAAAKDDWMQHIAAMPALRFLGAQDTSAGDDGFVALSKSRTIEYIWGRRCHNLRRRGFTALADMPALRGLSVSCLNVDDEGISALPSFPALRELMPMDIPDAGYRHVGKCTRLESLILMYCRDTTDAATEQITGLNNLLYYFNSYTNITDRTPAILSTLDSLERVTFDECHQLTNAGVSQLARLPRLREVRVAGRRLTPAVARGFPPRVEVHYSL